MYTSSPELKFREVIQQLQLEPTVAAWLKHFIMYDEIGAAVWQSYINGATLKGCIISLLIHLANDRKMASDALKKLLATLPPSVKVEKDPSNG
jgi:hypothetical protein